MIDRRGTLALLASGGAAAAAHPEPGAPAATVVALDDPRVRPIENVWIPMADGARLAARLFLPAQPAAGGAGAVLEYLPYRKRDGYRYRDDAVRPFLAANGFAFVRVDIRGTGESDRAALSGRRP